MAIAKQGGVLTCNPDPIDPSMPVTVSYDGTGTNFANWEPKCHIHAWVVSKSDPSKSIANMDWANCKGDADYAALDSKVKMTQTAIGKYEITLTIKDFFGLTDDQVADAGKLGIIVRAQYGGDDNQTSDMFLAIGEPIIPVDRFGINWGVDQQEGWQSAEFVQSQENENIYTVEVEVPEDFADISFWVGKNKNGVGNPEWNEGISATALLSAIEGVKAGMNVFAIDKTSTEKNWDIKDQKIVVLGAGGAANAIIVEAALLGAREIVVYNRSDKPYIRELNEKLNCSISLKLLSNINQLKDDLLDTYLLVQTTNVGMEPQIDECLIPDSSYLPNHLKVADIIYKPAQTKLLKIASEKGLECMNGEGMILYQGAVSFEYWTGKKMPIQKVKQALGME